MIQGILRTGARQNVATGVAHRQSRHTLDGITKARGHKLQGFGTAPLVQDDALDTGSDAAHGLSPRALPIPLSPKARSLLRDSGPSAPPLFDALRPEMTVRPPPHYDNPSGNIDIKLFFRRDAFSSKASAFIPTRLLCNPPIKFSISRGDSPHEINAEELRFIHANLKYNDIAFPLPSIPAPLMFRYSLPLPPQLCFLEFFHAFDDAGRPWVFSANSRSFSGRFIPSPQARSLLQDFAMPADGKPRSVDGHCSWWRIPPSSC